ncbi:hypothetical protein OROMI_004333 [Orobanche minor]
MNFFLHIRSKSFRQTGEIANLKPYSLKLWKFGRFISSIAPPLPPQPAPAQPIPTRRPPLKSPSIFVIGLPNAASMDRLKSVFGVYGNIKSANFYPPEHASEENDDENRKSKHKCAFIHYYKLGDAEYARKEMHFMFFDGSVIFVDPVTPRGPPKGGGGATKGSGGITAASGVAAELGIPLTHRGVANSVRFLTGHSQKGGTDPLFVAVNAADPKSTIVVYMGLSTLPSLASKLMYHGLPDDTPAAAIERGTTPQQRIVFSELKDDEIATNQLISPSLIIIGKVVALSPLWPHSMKETSTLTES